MSLKITLSKHEHSLITFGVVLIATLFGYGLYALVLMVGFWFGREHSQAEYRYMKLKGINRSKLGFFDGFRKEAWSKDSLINDLILPIMVGLLTICIQILFGLEKI